MEVRGKALMRSITGMMNSLKPVGSLIKINLSVDPELYM